MVKHAYFTNDHSEHKLLINKAVDRLQATINEEDRKYNEFLLCPLMDFNISPHIACFSSEPDLLSQWRAYSGDGDGFTIGFSVEALQRQIKAFSDQQIPIRLWTVSYETQDQENILDQYLGEYQAARPVEMRDMDELFRIAMNTYSIVWTVAAICKNHGFHEECEHRILLMPMLREDETGGLPVPDLGTSPLQFRVTDREIIPYYTFSFPENAITDIWLGPKNYARNNVDALQSFLRANGYNVDNIKISLSEATYH